MSNGRFYIGTSGWSYAHWAGPFYPETVSAGQRLAHYQTQLNSTEINNSFYRLPEAETLRRWCQTVGPDFVFSIKASRYITHMKKLKVDDDSLARFMGCVRSLDEHLGVILFQLPPRWHANPERLVRFLNCLEPKYRYAFEFRDESWIGTETFEILREHNAAFCIYELAGYSSPHEVTADFVYIRLHGPAEAYRGSYDQRALSGWAGAISTWTRRGFDVYLYFDNDEAGYAAQNARSLTQMLSA